MAVFLSPCLFSDFSQAIRLPLLICLLVTATVHGHVDESSVMDRTVKPDDEKPEETTPAPAETWVDEQTKQQTELNKLKEEEIDDATRQANKEAAATAKSAKEEEYKTKKAEADKGTDTCQALKTTINEKPEKPAPEVFKALHACLESVLAQSELLKFQNVESTEANERYAKGFKDVFNALDNLVKSDLRREFAKQHEVAWKQANDGSQAINTVLSHMLSPPDEISDEAAKAAKDALPAEKAEMEEKRKNADDKVAAQKVLDEQDEEKEKEEEKKQTEMYEEWKKSNEEALKKNETAEAGATANAGAKPPVEPESG